MFVKLDGPQGPIVLNVQALMSAYIFLQPIMGAEKSVAVLGTTIEGERVRLPVTWEQVIEQLSDEDGGGPLS